MTRTRHIYALCLALMLGSAPVLAQTEQPAPAAPAASASKGTPQKTPASQSPAGNTKLDASAGENSKKGSSSSGGSPYDYRASEEISEDLPVSFPADI